MELRMDFVTFGSFRGSINEIAWVAVFGERRSVMKESVALQDKAYHKILQVFKKITTYQ